MRRAIAAVYSVLVGLLSAYAWWIDIAMRHSIREHLLPDILLMVASLPTSLSLASAYSAAPSFFARPFAELSYLTLCAVAQVLIAWWAAGTFKRKPPSRPNNRLEQRVAASLRDGRVE